jgi:hypothetical protein
MLGQVGLAADLPLPFFDEAISRGVLYAVDQGSWSGCGVALVDLDNDGDADLVCTGSITGETGLFINDGTGNFTQKLASGLPLLMNASGTTAADYDGDGDLDLHFTSMMELDQLFRNDGMLTFTDVTAEAGMLGAVGSGTGAAWSDFDGDGDIDLYVPNFTHTDGDETPNHLWRNNGDGTFTDVAQDLGVDDPYLTWQAIWFDYDADGDPDLYLSNDRGGTISLSNRLFRNDGGVFTEVSDESGADAEISSMGVAVGDIDSNGHLDLYCTNRPPGNPLFLNNGDGTFTDTMDDAAVGSFATGWGAHFFDFDNDADEDLYVCNMVDDSKEISDGLNRLYRNPGSFPMEEVAAYCNAACFGDSYALVVGDLDDDGDLDMIIQNHLELIKVLINTEGDLRNWVKFDVKGVGMNKYAVGARLIADTKDRFTTHEIAAGSNFKSTNDYIEHFGLGDATTLYSLDIRFPDGELRTLSHAPANETWTLLHPQLLGDVDGDGDHDPVDLSGFVAAYGVTSFESGWEVLDFTGNFHVDDDDILAFLDVYSGPIDDCDADGTVDAVQIARGEAPDKDLDGVIDNCSAICVGDVNDDGTVDGADLTLVLSAWGTADPESDLNSDGTISGADLTILLGRWGPC